MKGVPCGKNLEGTDVILTEMSKESSDSSNQDTTNSLFCRTNFHAKGKHLLDLPDEESLTTALVDLRLTDHIDIGSTSSSRTRLQDSSLGANYGVTNYNYSTPHSSFTSYNMLTKSNSAHYEDSKVEKLPSYLLNVPVNSINTRRLPEEVPVVASPLVEQLYAPYQPMNTSDMTMHEVEHKMYSRNNVGQQNLHQQRLSRHELFRMSPQLNADCQSIFFNRYTDGYNSELLIGQDELCRLLYGERLQCSFADHAYRARTTPISLEMHPQKIIDMAKDQNGCLHLQNVLKDGNSQVREYIFMHVIANIVELMIDPYGNYLVQLLVEGSNETQRTKVVCEITKVPGQLLIISCDMYGTRVIQKVIEAIKRRPDLISMVIFSLNPGVLDLMMDPNGNHVIQRCLQHMDPEYTLFILETALAHCFDLARNRQGCCVLQKCIFHSSKIMKYQLVQSIAANAPILAKDQFANYVIQFIILMKVPWMTNRIVDQLDSWFGALSMHKCSSNVVQKCLEHGGEANCERIIRELILKPNELLDICLDQFGNYVIQSAIQFSKGAIRAELVEFIRQRVPALQNSSFGRIVLAKLGMKKR